MSWPPMQASCNGFAMAATRTASLGSYRRNIGVEYGSTSRRGATDEGSWLSLPPSGRMR